MDKDGGFQITIDVNGEGVFAATGVRRTNHYNDKGSLVGNTVEPETLEQLAEKFPWPDYIDPAIKAALLKAEATDQLQADLAAAQDTIKQKEAEVETHKATIADRDALLQAANNDQIQVAQLAANVVNGLANAIKARQAKEEKKEIP